MSAQLPGISRRRFVASAGLGAVIPGHGPIGGRAEMIECRDTLATIRDRVAALKGDGKSLNEIVAAKATAAYDAKWGKGKGFVNGDFFTKLVYAGV